MAGLGDILKMKPVHNRRKSLDWVANGYDLEDDTFTLKGKPCVTPSWMWSCSHISTGGENIFSLSDEGSTVYVC